MKVFNLEQIKKRIDLAQIISLQEKGFVLHSQGKTNIPMPGYLEQENPKGSYHIKYGLISGDAYWVVKIAGCPDHLPINGAMLAISTKTGSVEYILNEEGYLTALRTATAGLIAAKYLASSNVSAIGVLGTGNQARMQVELLKHFTNCKEVFVWGRSEEKRQLYKRDMDKKGFRVTTTNDVSQITQNCNLIITTTASKSALIMAEHVKPGTHITAVGADSPNKIELDPALVAKSDVLVADDIAQCLDHGELSHAHKKGLIQKSRVIELGSIINSPSAGRINDKQITIADLTGLAVQDIQIVKAVVQYKDRKKQDG